MLYGTTSPIKVSCRTLLTSIRKSLINRSTAVLFSVWYDITWMDFRSDTLDVIPIKGWCEKEWGIVESITRSVYGIFFPVWYFKTPTSFIKRYITKSYFTTRHAERYFMATLISCLPVSRLDNFRGLDCSRSCTRLLRQRESRGGR